MTTPLQTREYVSCLSFIPICNLYRHKFVAKICAGTWYIKWEVIFLKKKSLKICVLRKSVVYLYCQKKRIWF